MNYKEQFFRKLEDMFVGERVQGEGGYINLMRIKTKYFKEGILPILKKEIAEALRDFHEFEHEFFEKLYTFFEPFFSENGSVYFRFTPVYKNIYEKVYTDEKDVVLFWKTHMLYYVKSDRLFKDLEVEVGDFKFFFDVSELEHKKSNEKRSLVYELKQKREDGVIVFRVLYSERGRKTDIEDILKKLKDKKLKENVLQKAFSIFEKQSEVDYFINKNAKEFLREQFDLWLYQYIFRGQTNWT
ncbi:MAG: hypothetical protein NZ853_01425 [Leptospiraceae bacterium]|nr:hypothetical protein [Leptospiraceae bacterium]MDW7976112.1 hypothetical protein [Leptospiraceae bacterium]